MEQQEVQVESAVNAEASVSEPERDSAAESAAPVPIVLSDEQVKLVYEGERCIACDGRKRAGQAFCPTDFAALGLYARIVLSKGLAGRYEVAARTSGFFDTFRSALRHLQLNPQRMRALPVRGGEWRYRSEEDLEAAGYKFIAHARCEVPGCYARMVWYWTPQKSKVCVNLENYQPHRTSCADPEYFQRKREAKKALQSSARRKRRAR